METSFQYTRGTNVNIYLVKDAFFSVCLLHNVIALAILDSRDKGFFKGCNLAKQEDNFRRLVRSLN